jgi:hypothetical protein
MLWVASHLQQGGGTCPEEQVVEQTLVLEYQRGQLMRQSEDNVEVWHRQQFGGARQATWCARCPDTSDSGDYDM